MFLNGEIFFYDLVCFFYFVSYGWKVLWFLFVFLLNYFNIFLTIDLLINVLTRMGVILKGPEYIRTCEAYSRWLWYHYRPLEKQALK